MIIITSREASMKRQKKLSLDFLWYYLIARYNVTFFISESSGAIRLYQNIKKPSFLRAFQINIISSSYFINISFLV